MHPEAYNYVARFATDKPVSVVEIGSRNVNTTVRPLFPNADYWGIDAQAGPCVDEVADGATWRPLAKVDLVVCCEVFEHTPYWRDIVSNVAKNMLLERGRAVFTMAGPGRPEHGVNIDDPLSPGWYRNITEDDLLEAMVSAGFTAIEVDGVGTDVRGTGLRR